MDMQCSRFIRVAEFVTNMRSLHQKINKKDSWKQKAFTLIELLIVIAIIALMSTIVLIAVNSARIKGRQASRVANLRSVQTALELYNQDFGAYPNTSNNWYGTCSAWTQTTQNNAIPGLVSTYLGSLPVDPIVSVAGNTNCYLYNSNGTDYKYIDYNLTDITASQAATQYTTFADPARNNGLSPCSVGSMNPAVTLGVWTSNYACY